MNEPDMPPRPMKIRRLPPQPARRLHPIPHSAFRTSRLFGSLALPWNGISSLASRGTMEERGWGEEAVFVGQPPSLYPPPFVPHGERESGTAGSAGASRYHGMESPPSPPEERWRRGAGERRPSLLGNPPPFTLPRSCLTERGNPEQQARQEPRATMEWNLLPRLQRNDGGAASKAVEQEITEETEA